ncbi:MAG: peptide-methionine (S)-S-oxide reductase MsrA [Xanthomonadales bacterium]|nr:peptide-methionine (S)-S-oxide reductase MsrA [Xanthomonadales bacterium]
MNDTIELATQVATFGAGCFWGVEARFREVDGVLDATSGYMGGEVDDPGYKAVCSGKTGHAEVVQVKYDPRRVTYETLLGMFFAMHNPTTLNRQGPDIGNQYRSVVFFYTDKQKDAAHRAIEELEHSGRWPNPVVTAVEPAQPFWPAEEYHQRYLEKHGLGSCSL